MSFTSRQDDDNASDAPRNVSMAGYGRACPLGTGDPGMAWPGFSICRTGGKIPRMHGSSLMN